MTKLTYEYLVNTCQALGTFADARMQPVPNKDVVLVLKEVGGQKILQAAKKSEITENWQTTRSGKGWNATLKAVEKYMHENELYLPNFSCLKNSSLLAISYDQDAIHVLNNMEKSAWKALQLQKARGIEAFINCIGEYNTKNPFLDICTAFRGYEKKTLLRSERWSREISYVLPNPMSGDGDEKSLRTRYVIPIIEPEEFPYLSPFHRNHRYSLSAKVLGYCYEHGLGAKKNIERAIEQYTEAANQGEFSACYNLGRLCMVSNLCAAIKYLEKAKDILEDKIKTAELSIRENTLELTKEHAQKMIEEKIAEIESDIKKLESRENLEKYELDDLEDKKGYLQELKEIVHTPEDIAKFQKGHTAFCEFCIRKWTKPLQKVLSLLAEATAKAEKA